MSINYECVYFNVWEQNIFLINSSNEDQINILAATQYKDKIFSVISVSDFVHFLNLKYFWTDIFKKIKNNFY